MFVTHAVYNVVPSLSANMSTTCLRAITPFALTKLSTLDRDGSLSGVFPANFRTSLITVGILLFEAFKLSKFITHSIVALVYCCEIGSYNCTVLSSKRRDCKYSMEDSISLMFLFWSLIWFSFSITHSLWNAVIFCSSLICLSANSFFDVKCTLSFFNPFSALPKAGTRLACIFAFS